MLDVHVIDLSLQVLLFSLILFILILAESEVIIGVLVKDDLGAVLALQVKT